MFHRWKDVALRTSRRTYGAILLALVAGAAIVWAVVTEHLIFLILMVCVIIGVRFMVRRARTSGQEREAKIAEAEDEGLTAWPKRFGPWILPNEKAECEGRQYPIAIWAWWLLFFGGPLLALITLPFALNGMLFLILFFVPPLVSSWKILEWWLDWWAITNIRVVKIEGVFSEEAPAAQLAQILTARPVVPPFSRWVLRRFGFPHYGHIVLETAAQVEAIKELRYVTNPEAVNQQLQSHFAQRNQDEVADLLREYLSRQDP